jgi:hypothetical protein
LSDFPEFPADPKHLGQAFFTECHASLAKKIHDETPVPFQILDKAAGPRAGTVVPDRELWQQHVDDAMADLSFWQSYALDGDVSLISGRGPWMTLVDRGNALYSRACSDMKNAVADMDDVWTGDAHREAKRYLQTTAGLVEGYCPSPGSAEMGIINEAAIHLEGAYLTVLAFKKDLYNLARQASDALDQLDKGGTGEAVGVGLVVSGFLLEGLGAVLQNAKSPVTAFGGGLLSTLGDMVMSKGTDKLEKQYVGGRDPGEIMRTLRNATDKAQDGYSAAAVQAGKELSNIWEEIDSKLTSAVMRPLSAPAPNVSVSPSLQLSRLFPDG